MSLKLERNRVTLEKYNSIQLLRIVPNETKMENEENVDRTIENAVREQKVKMPRRQQKRLRKIVKINYNYRDVDLSDGGVSDRWSNRRGTWCGSATETSAADDDLCLALHVRTADHHNNHAHAAPPNSRAREKYCNSIDIRHQRQPATLSERSSMGWFPWRSVRRTRSTGRWSFPLMVRF